MEGFIYLWRKFTETSFYKDSHMVHLAIHLLLKANHKPNRFIFNGKEEILQTGQCIVGLKKLHQNTGISVQTLRTCLRYLCTVGFLTSKSTNKFTIITICKYNEFQSKPTSNLTSNLTNNQQTTNKQLTTNNNDNNDNKKDTPQKVLAKEVFGYYKAAIGKRLEFTQARREMIDKVLKRGYGLEDCKKAINNFKNDEWSDRSKYLDPSYCFATKGKIDNFEKWLNIEPKKEAQW